MLMAEEADPTDQSHISAYFLLFRIKEDDLTSILRKLPLLLKLLLQIDSSSISSNRRRYDPISNQSLHIIYRLALS